MALHKNELQRRRRERLKKRCHRTQTALVKKVAEQLREGNDAAALLLIVTHAFDSPEEELQGEARMIEVFREIGQLADDPSVPASARLEFARAILHASSVAEWCRSRGLNGRGDEEAGGLCARVAMEADRLGFVRDLRELISRGEITLDELDPPPPGNVTSDA